MQRVTEPRPVEQTLQASWRLAVGPNHHLDRLLKGIAQPLRKVLRRGRYVRHRVSSFTRPGPHTLFAPCSREMWGKVTTPVQSPVPHFDSATRQSRIAYLLIDLITNHVSQIYRCTTSIYHTIQSAG